MIIKALLILGLVTATVLLSRGRPSATELAVRRGGAIVFLILGVVAVLFPNAVTIVANAVGVGRGTDLVLYAFVIAFLLTSVALYRKLHDLEVRYVELVRYIAIQEAQDRAEPANTSESTAERRATS